MTEGIQNLTQQIQEQVLTSAQDFYENSLCNLMGHIQSDRSQLQELLEQLPESQEDARERLEQLLASYEAIENSLEEDAQQQGVEEAVKPGSPAGSGDSGRGCRASTRCRRTSYGASSGNGGTSLRVSAGHRRRSSRAGPGGSCGRGNGARARLRGLRVRVWGG